MNYEQFIVGIGASAGGESALYDFFEGVPRNLEASFVVIRHLKRDYHSQMKFLLSKHTRLPIFNIRNGESIKPNCIYLMPENTTAVIKEGGLFLKERDPDENINFAINEFFISLAEDAKEKAIGIILSGTGTDGTIGANAIEAHGGIVMVQEPKSAKYEGMPAHAIDQDFPDYILTPQEMGKHLSEYIKSREKVWEVNR